MLKKYISPLLLTLLCLGLLPVGDNNLAAQNKAKRKNKTTKTVKGNPKTEAESSPKNNSDFVVDIQALTSETQQSTSSTDKIQLVWWITTDYWKAVFESDPTTSNEATEDLLKTIDKYILLAVVDGEIGLFGSIDYRNRVDIAEGLRIKGNYNQLFAPLNDEAIDGDLKLMLEISMKTISKITSIKLQLHLKKQPKSLQVMVKLTMFNGKI